MDRASIRQGLKYNAKDMLRGNYGPAIGMFAVMFGISVVLSVIANVYTMSSSFMQMMDYVGVYGMSAAVSPLDLLLRYGSLLGVISGISLVISLLILAPLTFGMMYWYIELSKGNKLSFSTLFDFFASGKKFGRALLMNLLLGLRIFLWSLLSIIVTIGGSVCLGLGLAGVLPTYACVALIVLGILLYLAGIAFLIFIELRYTMVPYYSIVDLDMPAGGVFKKSVRHMKGHKGEAFVLELSFLGWALLSVLTCGILLFWLAPYMQATYTLYYNYICGEGERTDAFAQSQAEIR